MNKPKQNQHWLELFSASPLDGDATNLAISEHTNKTQLTRYDTEMVEENRHTAKHLSIATTSISSCLMYADSNPFEVEFC